MSYGISWEPAYGGHVPEGAEQAGLDQDGSPLYAGRAVHEGEMLPAKVKRDTGAWVAWGGGEHEKEHYEVLVSDSIAWKVCQNGDIPPTAVCVGNCGDGEPLYMGRAHHEGTITPGKVHRTHGCIYIPFGGQEISKKTYEVLIKV